MADGRPSKTQERFSAPPGALKRESLPGGATHAVCSGGQLTRCNAFPGYAIEIASRTSEGQAALWHNRSEPDVSSGDRVVERDARELLRDDECALVDDPVSTVIDLLTFPIQRTEVTSRPEEMCVSAGHRVSAGILGVCNLSSGRDARDEAVPDDELSHPLPHPCVL